VVHGDVYIVARHVGKAAELALSGQARRNVRENLPLEVALAAVMTEVPMTG
jgi:hypothetical protein